VTDRQPTHPTIADAKELATRHRRRGVIVLSFGAADFALASYGHTRADCAAMRGVVEQVAGLIEAGTLAVPDGFGTEPAPPPRSGDHEFTSDIGRILEPGADLLTQLVWIDRLDAGLDRTNRADVCEVLRVLCERLDAATRKEVPDGR
jgi:hypothetical protein